MLLMPIQQSRSSYNNSKENGRWLISEIKWLKKCENVHLREEVEDVK